MSHFFVRKYCAKHSYIFFVFFFPLHIILSDKRNDVSRPKWIKRLRTLCTREDSSQLTTLHANTLSGLCLFEWENKKTAISRSTSEFQRKSGWPSRRALIHNGSPAGAKNIAYFGNEEEIKISRCRRSKSSKLFTMQIHAGLLFFLQYPVSRCCQSSHP